MATNFILPDIGEGIVEAEIIEWLVKEGDVVKADQPIVKIETDKAVADLPVPVSGTILRINFKEGETARVGAVLCVIGNAGEKINVKKEINYIEKKTEAVPQKAISAPAGKVLAAPAVRKAAAEKGIDLFSISGSGDSGRILLSDLDTNAKSARKIIAPAENVKLNVQKKYDQFGYIERVPLKGVRKIIAQNMIKSLSTTAQVTSMEDIDVSILWELRQREKESFALEGIKLTFMPFIIKAIIAALQEHPILNSSLEGEDIVIKKYFNIGVAVETDAGLMVPVIKIAERKSIVEIAKEIASLAEKARNRTIDIMDLKGSTFTITNYGSIGGTYGTPIINPGEAGILGLGKIFDRAVLDSKGKLKNLKILPVSLTFDHQILDGAQASRFLETLKKILENPEIIPIK